MKLSTCIRILLAVLLALATTSLVAGDTNPHPRPFIGSLSGQADFDFDFVDSPCLQVTGAPWQTISTTIGEMTHLGLTEYYSTHCSALDGSALVDGEATLVAANGDELWMTYSATNIGPPPVPPVVLVYETEYIVDGGTGRFEGASGEILALVFVTIEDLTALSTPLDMEFAGYIIY